MVDIISVDDLARLGAIVSNYMHIHALAGQGLGLGLGLEPGPGLLRTTKVMLAS